MFGFLKRKKVDPKKCLAALMGDYALPSFPAVVLEALQEMRNEDGSAASVARVISRDPGLSIRLLKLVNSAAYGSARKTESVQQAVSMLGMSQVEALLLAIGVRTALPDADGPGFEASRFWRAAARRAEVAGVLAAEMHPASRHLSFTAALLGDMAVPLLADCPSLPYEDVLEEWHRGAAALEDLEQDAFGCHHGDVATWLCQEWDLPERLAEAIGGHHGDKELNCPAAVHLVGFLGETDENDGVEELVARACELGLSPEHARELVSLGFERGDSLAAQFS